MNTDAEKPARFDHLAFIAQHPGASTVNYPEGRIIYAHGDLTDTLFYIVRGTVKITVISEQGKEAIIALLQDGQFFGERAIVRGHPTHVSNALAASACEIVKIPRGTLLSTMKNDPQFVQLCLNILLDRNLKLQSDLIDQLFNSSEKRLARILLSLAHADPGNQANVVALPVTQETLANMVGTTRSRISQFMTKFRKLGYIEYNGQIKVHNSLLNIFLNEQPFDGEP